MNASSSIDYWQRKGHYLHLRSQADQPMGSQSLKCDRCGIMLWPERTGAETPEFTTDAGTYLASAYRCDIRAALEGK